MPLHGQGQQVAEVVVAASGHEVLLLQAQQIAQGAQGGAGHVLIVEEARRHAGLPFAQALAHLVHHGAGELLVQVQLGIAAQLHRMAVQDLVAAEELFEAEPDHIVQEDEVVLPLGRGQAHEASEGVAGHVQQHQPGALLALGADPADQVQLAVLDERGIARPDGGGVEQGHHGLRVMALHRLQLLGVQVVHAPDPDAMPLQGGQQFVPVQGAEALLLAQGLGVDLLDQLFRCDGQGAPVAFAQLGQASQAGHAHAVELVQVVAEDAQELHAFQEGHLGVHRLLEHPFVEGKPAEVAVVEAHPGQLVQRWRAVRGVHPFPDPLQVQPALPPVALAGMFRVEAVVLQVGQVLGRPFGIAERSFPHMLQFAPEAFGPFIEIHLSGLGTVGIAQDPLQGAPW